MNVLSRRSKVKPNVSPMVSEAAKKTDCSAISLADVVKPDPVVAYVDEPLRVVAQRMAQTGLTRFPVIERREERRKQPRPTPGIGGHGKLVGVIGLARLAQRTCPEP